MKNDPTVALIRRLVDQINCAWKTGHTDELRDLFHPEMVIVGPGFQLMCRGQEACVASYRDFIAGAAVREYSESQWNVEAWSGTAVATYAWSITYERGGERSRETGTDQFVFGQADGKWRALRRYVHFESA